MEFGSRDDSQIRESKPLGFTKTISVELDGKTGQITGWDSLWAFIDPPKGNIEKEINEVGSEYISKIKPGDFTIEKLDEDHFVLKHFENLIVYEIDIET